MLEEKNGRGTPGPRTAAEALEEACIRCPLPSSPAGQEVGGRLGTTLASGTLSKALTLRVNEKSQI